MDIGLAGAGIIYNIYFIDIQDCRTLMAWQDRAVGSWEFYSTWLLVSWSPKPSVYMNSLTAIACTIIFAQQNNHPRRLSLCLSKYIAMGPCTVPLPARTLRLRLPSLYRISVLPSIPLSNPRNSPRKATHCSHRFASVSSVFAPTSASAIRRQPLPMGLQLKSPLDKCYIIDEVLSERHAAGRIWCVYRAT